MINSAIIQNIIPVDHSKRARDNLFKQKKTRTLGSFFSEICNLILIISGTHDDEKIDRLLDETKNNIWVVELRAQVDTSDECTSVALKFDSPLWMPNNQSYRS